ncbi:GNAT family N-acetyltransferase [Cytobacillus oceanisediminis]|uniref:GNAT family N-acetyltransferase n=1 Tax=Cytobacillus oceanisediminis TaxID=665099 RepID=UPI001C220928|nr:GNAT family N-acetyltransferase [Cytobacillus oceanisediminis]MBU8733754.1 GNAT family N-acetyltransferase [Cytobacillus oceanisediminis]USK45993.1 GNAT family N-acetyltransferase [Cytobacillus oceanisediminis]
MAIGNLSSSCVTHADLTFFLEVIKDSAAWEEEEKSGHNLMEYMARYQKLNGEWRIWRLDGERIAVTFHVNSSPSNGKPWLGTILVKNSIRRKGIGTKIIEQLAAELKEKGEKSFFAGVPENRQNWIYFLADAGFEQFKMEASPDEKEFLIMVCPLI